MRDWDAAAYHRLPEPQLGWGREVFARLELGGGETAADVGCGTGRPTPPPAMIRRSRSTIGGST
ncbi:MAG: hypothetical protein ACRD1S_11415 [Vicinamibacterales bacterium]